MTRRVFVGVVLAAGILLCAGLAAVGLPLADIRPATVVVTDDPASQAEGQRLLVAMLESHGGAGALFAQEERVVELRDSWVGVAKLFNPWPDADQRARLVLRTHSFDSSVLFHNGPRAGETWGIRAGQVYRVDGSAEVPVVDAKMTFMLPTVHYFVEMPQRLTEAEIVRAAGTERVGDVEYDVVYATWGSLEANERFDQYRIYLHRDTHRLAKVWYTVREMGSFLEGVAHLDDQRNVGGFWFPHQVAVTAAVGDDPVADAMHTMFFSFPDQ